MLYEYMVLGWTQREKDAKRFPAFVVVNACDRHSARKLAQRNLDRNAFARGLHSCTTTNAERLNDENTLAIEQTPCEVEKLIPANSEKLWRITRATWQVKHALANKGKVVTIYDF